MSRRRLTLNSVALIAASAAAVIAAYWFLPTQFVVLSLAVLVVCAAVQCLLLLHLVQSTHVLQRQANLEAAARRTRSPAIFFEESAKADYGTIKQEIRQAATRGKTIIVGPWLTEIGFEILYWIPFLRKLLSDLRIPPQRVVALSRGGCAGWYSGIADRYIELFELAPTDEIVRATDEAERLHGGKKFVEPSDFEQSLIKLAAHRIGATDYVPIFSGSMYGLFRYAWASRVGGLAMAPFLSFKALDPAKFPLPDGFPVKEGYFAAKFYHSLCFPQTPKVGAFIKSKLLALAETAPVVLLNTGMRLDDHPDASIPNHPNIIDGTAFYGSHNNLAVQSALVAHSQRLYCTYGGFSYLGPLLQVPTVAFYDLANFTSSHLDLALRNLVTPKAGLAVLPISVDLQI